MELSFGARIGSIWESYVIANDQEGNKILYLDGGKHGKVANGSESLIMESMRSCLYYVFYWDGNNFRSKEKKNNLVKSNCHTS